MRILLLDADGVVLKKHRYFSEKFAEDYNISPEAIIPSFKMSLGNAKQGKLT